MKYKGVIFDLDGTLLNTLHDLYLSTNRALEKMNMPPRSEEEVCAFVGNGVEMLIKRALGEEHEDILPETLEIFKKDYFLHGEDNTKPYPGITDMLKKLNESGVKCAIVSNKFDGAVKSLSQKYFGELILCAVGESENVRKKPAPDSVFKVMEFLGLDKSSCVYVGDSDVDILTAKNARIPCISVTWGFRKREFLIKNGAAVLADTAEELWKIINGK